MSSFHSTVSRRDFMKMLGLTGAGLGAAAAAVPVFHDLDELMAAPQGQLERPWYVSEVNQSTTEIDWAVMNRYNANNHMSGMHRNEYMETYMSSGEQSQRSALTQEMEAQWRVASRPGYDVRSMALRYSAASARGTNSFTGPQQGYSPEAWGVPRWVGTPEENARTVRAAMRFFGSLSVGFGELSTSTTQKLIYTAETGDNPRNVFEDVDQAYQTDTKRVIPNKCRWVIVETNQESQESWKLNPTYMCVMIRYERATNIQIRLQNFINGLGYQCLGAGSNTLGIAPAFADLAGLGEHGRFNRLITPEYGPTVGAFRWVTDLPLAPGKPIDAGMNRFCRICTKCAEACGEGAISFNQEPTWVTVGPWNSHGHKAWFEDSRKCRVFKRLPEACYAGRCLTVCPFTHANASRVHEVVAAALSTTPLLNDFFETMYDFYSMGLRGRDHDDFAIGPRAEVDTAQEEWWYLNMPVNGYDSTIGSQENLT